MDDQTTPDWEGLHNNLAESLTSPEFMKQHPELPAGPVSPASYTDTNNLNGPGRHFQGDSSIKTFTGDVGNAYESAMTKAGAPTGLIKKGRQSVEDLAAKRARAYAIQTMKQSQTPEELAEYIPGIGHVAAYAKEQGNEKVIERLEKGEGSVADYQSLGNMLGSQTDEQNRGWWAQRGRNLLGIGQFAAEMAMTGGAAGAIGKAGVAAALGSKAATLGGRAAQFAGYGLGATAAMPQRILGEYAKSGERHIGLDEQGGITFSEPDSKPARLWKSVASNYIDNTIMPGVAGAFERAGAGGYAARVFKKSLMALAGVEASGDLKKAIAISPQGGPGWEVGQAVNSGDPERIKAALKNAAGAMLEMGILEGVVQAQGMRQQVGLKAPNEGHAANETAKHLIEETNANVQPPPANGEPQAAAPNALSPDATAASAAPNEAAAPAEGSQGAGGASLSPEDTGQGQAAQVNGAQATEGAGGQLAQPGREAESVPQVQGSADRTTEPGESGAVAGDAGSTGPAAAPTVPGTRSGVLDLYQNAAKLSDADYQVGLSKVEQELESMPKKQLKEIWASMGMVGPTSAEKIADLIQKRRDAFIQTQLINPNKKRPGIMDWEPPKAKQALPLEEMPKFDDTEAGRKAEAAWRAAHPEYGNEFNAGDNARPGATVLPPRPQVYDPIEQAIKEMAAQHLAMGEEGAMASGFPGLEKFHDAMWKHIVNTAGKIYDNLRQFAGHVVPATTRVDRESGEALTRYASAANFAREAAPNYIDRVMGEDATEADRRIAGAVITERRLRKIRDVLQAEGDVAGAAQVKTIIGVEDSPLKTEADYDRYLNSQKMQGILARYKEHFVPKMEDNFRRAQEMEPDDPIEARTQIEGEPVNLKFIREGEDAKAPVFFGQRQGNLKNTGLRRLGFSRQAKGNATGYDIDLGSIIENSLAKSEELAAKHDLFRTMEANGVGKRGKRGERIEINGEPAKEIPNVYQQKPIPINMGMEAINVPSKTSFYVDARAYDELRQALAVDQAPKFPVAAAAANLLNTSALASSVEAVYHSKNLLSFLFTKPGVRLGDFMSNLKDVWKNDPETRARLAELSRIGAMKAEGLESGQSKYNPLKFMGKYLDFLQRSVRLTADDAFERLKRSGLVEDTETNKRDFINQLGQYNKRLQNKMLVLFRNSGLGPFATAGTNYYMQGLRSLTFNPGVKASSASAALRLRMEALGKTAAVIGGATLANYALWGRVDGDDETPLGAIKVGEGDGKTQYFDLTSLTGFTRGLRETGLLSLAEGARKGDETAKPMDKAVDDIIHSAMHPFVGPIGQFAYTAATGKNTIGMQVAKEVSTAKTSKGLLKAEAMGKPPPGSSQKWENVKAALRNANPAIGVLGGYDRPNDEATPGEKAWKLLGPFGVKTKTHPKVYSKGTKRGQ